MLLRLVPALLVLASASSQATTYTFEANHTQGVMRWSHLGFSNPSATFSRVEGTLTYDAANPRAATVTATIPMANLSTGVPDLDDDFHSHVFFDLAHFPTATFKSTKVEPGAAGHLEVTGDLTIRDKTLPVTLHAKLNAIGVNPRNNLPTIGFAATAELKRSDFGLGRFVPQVSDQIDIEITAQGAEAKGYAELLRKQAEEEARDTQGTAAKAATQSATPPAKN